MTTPTLLERLLRRAEDEQLARGVVFLVCLLIALVLPARWIWV